jgi:hypothetical protein
VRGTSTRVGSGLSSGERPIWPFNPGQARVVRMVNPSQTLAHFQATKQAKIGSKEQAKG